MDFATPTPEPVLSHALSSDTSRLLGLTAVRRAAGTVPSGAVEIDLRRRWWSGEAGRFDPDAVDVPIAAVWLAPLPPDRGPERTQWAALTERVANDWRPSKVIVELPRGDIDHRVGKMVGDLFTFFGDIGSDRARLAIGIPTPHLHGGRTNLVQLRSLRRFTEEWEVDVAVDVGGQLDQQWEAEAGIARLGHRLALIRIPGDALLPVPVGRPRVAMRALHAALDPQWPLCVSVVPRVPLWGRTAPAVVARAYAESAARLEERVRQRRVDLPLDAREPRRGQRLLPPA